jgi:transcriptional regulator with XRE-family HTH domain
MDLGGRIVEIREALGLSQTELARRAGLNQPTLNRIESQETEKTSAANLIAIARALGVRVEDLVEDAQRTGDILINLGDGDLLIVEFKTPNADGIERLEQLHAYAQRLSETFPEAEVSVRPFSGHGISTLAPAPTPPVAGETKPEKFVRVPVRRLDEHDSKLRELTERLERLERPAQT